MTDGPGRHARVALSIVIPAFDEATRIGHTVTRVLGYLNTRPESTELIVVLDGGRPGAATAVADASAGDSRVHLIDNGRNRGKGFSVRQGVLASQGERVVFADADMSLPIEHTDRFLSALAEGADVAVGSRMVPGATVGGAAQPWRSLLSRLFSAIVRTVAVHDVRDTQCGFKAFQGDVARDLFKVQRIDRFGFDVEILRIAQRWGLRVVEVPVHCEYRETSSVRKLRDGLQMLSDVARTLKFDASGAYTRPPSPATATPASRRTVISSSEPGA